MRNNRTPLEEEIRWSKEALALAEAQENGFHVYDMMEARKEAFPSEWVHLTNLNVTQLQVRVERLERDYRDSRGGQ